jgi:hypothetical protein
VAGVGLATSGSLSYEGLSFSWRYNMNEVIPLFQVYAFF